MLGASLLPASTLHASSAAAVQDLPASDPLGRFAHHYLETLRAPGMTVSLLSGDHINTRVFGWSNRESRLPVTSEQPFWIGSICKSFVGILAMQLRDEGKLDLHKPILEMMPDLPIANDFGPITTHHLLTHTSGLPNWLQLFACDPLQKARQQYAPGTRFAYCNLAFDILGFLIAHLDGRSWPESVRARIFVPLGMSGATSQIDEVVQARMPVGYHYQYRDRPSALVDPLVPVGYVSMSNAAGSIAATPDDMGRYMRMLVQHGRTEHGRIVSEEGFDLFSKPYIAAPVLSPNASYGYGIGVETMDGRKMLRHTGGATAFASSILVDLDGGVGAFASINAMQGFRPNPVTKFATDLLFAAKSGHAVPAAPTVANPLEVTDAAAFAATYKAAAGETVTVAAQGTYLSIATPRGTSSLRPLGGDLFSAADGKMMDGAEAGDGPSLFALQFERTGVGASRLVGRLNYGPHSYARSQQAAPDVTSGMAGAKRYEGLFTNDSPWAGSLRIVARNGKLWLEGVEEMHPQAPDSFTVRGGEGTVELTFQSFLDGRAQALRIDGDVMRRVSRMASA